MSCSLLQELRTIGVSDPWRRQRLSAASFSLAVILVLSSCAHRCFSIFSDFAGDGLGGRGVSAESVLCTSGTSSSGHSLAKQRYKYKWKRLHQLIITCHITNIWAHLKVHLHLVQAMDTIPSTCHLPGSLITTISLLRCLLLIFKPIKAYLPMEGTLQLEVMHHQVSSQHLL
ncbi:hypothetical protein SAY87_009614 [Trapa incisa]|uniref:Uncharacterized protein n=1 Tax=Trapa incisa TaxID=236973 RepID=A0AAN7JZC3_9MYRT|nr:hypothetical protein SAY87_009614 [Trapa incisa]